MRHFLMMVAFILVSCVAQGAEDKDGFSPEQEAQLDALFTQLKYAETENESLVIAGNIWHIWFNPDNSELQSMMSLAMTSLKESDFPNALDLLNKITTKWPEYSEGRNQLAVLHFVQNNYEQSLIEIAETLTIEPRHFGALAGRGVIRIRQGNGALGFQNIIEAMKIYPFIPERYLLPPSYREKPKEGQKAI